MDPDFVHLAAGFAINKSHISHIDFRKTPVMVHVGPNSVPASGADAAKLRQMFEPTPEKNAAETKASAEGKAAAEKKAAPAQKADKADEPAK